jgi:macrolide transport system ATP-binding/permease protein
MSEADRVERGTSPDDAQTGARREFGNVELVKETTRDTWGSRWLEDLYEDSRYGLRTLRRSPGFAAVAILTLALGIGANTAVFTVINGVLLRSMPFPEADRLFLVSLNTGFQQFEWQLEVSDRDYLAFRGQEQSFEQSPLLAREAPQI